MLNISVPWQTAISTIAWSPDGTTIASGSWDTTVQVWQAATGERRVVYNGHTDIVVTLIFRSHWW